MFKNVIRAATRKIADSGIRSLPNWTRKNPVRDERGVVKNMIVKIWPPLAIPNMLTAAAGKVEKWPPSQRKATATQSVYKMTWSVK